MNHYPEAILKLINSLSTLPGIGKKTAERVCIELKDKLGLPKGNKDSTPVMGMDSAAAAADPDGSNVQAFSDAVQALMALGYKMDVADKSVRKASQELGKNPSTEALVKAALKTG